MATLPLQSVTRSGLVLDLSATASAGGDSCPTGPGLLLAVKNADSASHTITLVTPGTVDGNAIADRVVTVAAGATVFVPVTDVYRDRSTGLASWTYDAVTSVTIAAFRVG